MVCGYPTGWTTRESEFDNLQR